MKVVISIVFAFLFVGCSENSKEEVQKVKEVIAQKVVPTAKESVKELQKVVKEVKVKVAEVISKEHSLSSAKDGKTIYAVCAGCHGSNAQKAALGKSKIIKGWSVAKVTDALNGYKAGTYGGMMKGVMKGQASKLSDSDIKLVAKYISSL